MPGAELGHLPDKLQAGVCANTAKRSLYRVRPVASYYDGVSGVQAVCGLQHMVNQRKPGQAVQDLRQAAHHAGTLTRRHNDHVQGEREANQIVSCHNHAFFIHIFALGGRRLCRYLPNYRRSLLADPGRLQRCRSGL